MKNKTFLVIVKIHLFDHCGSYFWSKNSFANSTLWTWNHKLYLFDSISLNINVVRFKRCFFNRVHLKKQIFVEHAYQANSILKILVYFIFENFFTYFYKITIFKLFFYIWANNDVFFSFLADFRKYFYHNLSN